MEQHKRILIGALAGALAGILANSFAGGSPLLADVIHYVSQPLGQLFLRLLSMLVLPLVFSGLVLGIAGAGDVRRLGRIGLTTLAYALLLSVTAVALGLILVNLIEPGIGLSPEIRASLLANAGERAAAITPGAATGTGWNLLLQIVPDNPIRAMANGDILAVIFFALAIGVGVALTPSPAVERFREAIEGLYTVAMRLIGFVIRLAPYGVAALLFTLTAQVGYEVIVALGRYVSTALLALALHMAVTYSLVIGFAGGMTPWYFFTNIQQALLTAFSTASSSATLPTALKVAEEDLHLPAHISRFVLTLGATANQNGTALFEGVTVLFLAQFYGIDLSLAEQGGVMFICVLAGIGTAGVPAGALPVLILITGRLGIPAEGIGLVLGVDRLLDMCRTAVNVAGDLVIAAVVTERERDRE